jgi:glutamyl-tRNA reductase
MVGRGAVAALLRLGCRVTWAYHVNVPDLSAPEFSSSSAPKLVQLGGIEAALAEADIVLTAVDSSRPVVTREMGSVVQDRNVLMVDLGVPRNIDPFYDDCGHGVTVADLDDLKLWHRVKTGTLKEVLARADEVIRSEYRAMA